jgi:transcriptional regulator with XRE-family HTH domain
MNDAELWSQWLIDRMAEAGIDAAELIARSNGQFGNTAVSKWLHGVSRPGPETALQVAEILGVPESEVFGASGHLKLAGVVSKLAAAPAGNGSSIDEMVQTIIGFEHLTEGQRAKLVEVYREHAEAARKRVQAMADEMLKQRGGLSD